MLTPMITWGAPTGAYGLRAAAIAKRYAAAKRAV